MASIPMSQGLTLAGILFAPGMLGGGATATLAASAYMASFTAGAGTASAATLYIDNAPSGATKNYALWVAAGDARFDGNIAAKYQDVAEWVPSAQPLYPGRCICFTAGAAELRGPPLRAVPRSPASSGFAPAARRQENAARPRPA